ncbi:MAG: hypothetical protein RL026_503 [Pseudomonadota bacterium]|jgi:cell division protein FtsI (penicillin-binding protein 3)
MSIARRGKSTGSGFSGRLLFLFALMMCVGLLLLARAVQLQTVDAGFLASQGDQRQLRDITVLAHRGNILDRNGEPLAVSTPVDSVTANPQLLARHAEHWDKLARMVNRAPADVRQQLSTQQQKSFVFLARHLPPAEAARVRELDLEGLSVQREYRRYYPAGEVAGHVLGFTNIDDNGQEGMELAYDHWLGGRDGRKRVRQDNRGRVLEDVESVVQAEPGKDLHLSIDLRIQYLAYRELLAAMQAHNAAAGSVVVVDVRTGEVLAMVNQPGFNPNDRSQYVPGTYRNRAVTDMLEPGSSIKPFIVAAALESGRFEADSRIDAGNGFMKIGNTILEDDHPLGVTTLAMVLAKSSNIGLAKIALALEPQQLWGSLRQLGFGQVTASTFPGESAGILSDYSKWRQVTISSLSRGYSLSVTSLQLAQAYATLGALGVARPVSLLRAEAAAPVGRRVLSETTARDVIDMLETVVMEGGTGTKAAIPGYRVAGKTGTARKLSGEGYSREEHVGVFAGVAPASAPRLAAVVVIDTPAAGQYYGGDVAAPVFAAVVGGALRLQGVAPDLADGATGRQVVPAAPAVVRR